MATGGGPAAGGAAAPANPTASNGDTNARGIAESAAAPASPASNGEISSTGKGTGTIAGTIPGTGTVSAAAASRISPSELLLVSVSMPRATSSNIIIHIALHIAVQTDAPKKKSVQTNAPKASNQLNMNKAVTMASKITKLQKLCNDTQ